MECMNKHVDILLHLTYLYSNCVDLKQKSGNEFESRDCSIYMFSQLTQYFWKVTQRNNYTNYNRTLQNADPGVLLPPSG